VIKMDRIGPKMGVGAGLGQLKVLKVDRIGL